MKLSVIIPAYNVETTIQHTLDSICRQTMNDLEIIIINDGSTDCTGEIVDSYAKRDDRIIVKHTINQGVTKTRLTGVCLSTGEWIGFVDGDDFIDPNMFSRLMSNAIMYEADISHCGYQMIFPDGRIHYFYNTGVLEVHDRTTGLCELLSGKKIEPGLCNKIYKKELFDKIIKYDLIPADISINEDLLMNYYLFNNCHRSVFDDKCLYHYMIRAGSTTRAGFNLCKVQDPIRVKEIIMSNCDQSIVNAATKSYINTCITAYNCLLISECLESNLILSEVRDRIISMKSDFCKLEKKRKIVAILISNFPALYKFIYILYCRWIQNSPYE